MARPASVAIATPEIVALHHENRHEQALQAIVRTLPPGGTNRPRCAAPPPRTAPRVAHPEPDGRRGAGDVLAP